MASDGGTRQGRRIGWDIGGAHLKAAAAEDGRIVAVVQEPCALWQGLDRLDRAFDAVLARLGPAGAHAATMTGELVDLFSSRAEGVAALAEHAARRLGPGLTLYAGRAGWIAPAAAAPHADDVASANWHATAALAAHRLGAAGSGADGLLVDIGSTTTDLIPLRAGRVAARGYSDAERLATGELVYTGVTRTALMALGAEMPFAGRRVGTTAEYFATTADIYRLLDRLPEGADQHATADGRGKSAAESRLRLARMIGRDVEEASVEAWRTLAEAYAERQIRLVHDGALLALSGAGLDPAAPVVACGIGRFLAAELARRLGRPCRDLAELVPAADVATAARAADCAPAAALALLG